MNKMKITGIITIILLALSTSVNSFASGVHYLPDVTSEMSSPSYWADETDILMSYDEIENLNNKTVSAKGTNMYDLKAQPEVVDGISLNEAILKSSEADAAYYLGWTYFESEIKEKGLNEYLFIRLLSSCISVRQLFISFSNSFIKDACLDFNRKPLNGLSLYTL